MDCHALYLALGEHSGLIISIFHMDLAIRLPRLVFGNWIQWEDVKRMYQESREEEEIEVKKEIGT